MKNKNILVISTSQRLNSNSDILSDEFIKGALEAKHQVHKISLLDKEIQFCKGCLGCQKTGTCIIKDDVQGIIELMGQSDVIVFATPVYFYNVCGQLKTLLDRSNPLFNSNYKFRDIYLIMSAAEKDDEAFEGTIQSVKGWIDCFDKSSLKGVVLGKDVTNIKDVIKKQKLIDEAYLLGKSVL